MFGIFVFEKYDWMCIIKYVRYMDLGWLWSIKNFEI